MSGTEAVQVRLYRRLLRVYPGEFRARYGEAMVQLFDDQLRDARAKDRPAPAAGIWLATLADLAATAASEHTRRDRAMAHTIAAAPSPSVRALGMAGILGGLVLVAVFFIDLAPELNTLRLALFNLGAIAIVAAVHRRQASAGHRQSLATATAAIVANAAYLVFVLLAAGRPQFPDPDPDFRLLMFVAGAAMWSADAVFGVVAMRLRAVRRWGALALAVGSALALLGMDRLGLVQGEFGALVMPLALIGIALNGFGLILLGVELATRRHAIHASVDLQLPKG